MVYNAELWSHHQSHILVQTESVQHIIDRIPSAYLVLARGVKRVRHPGDVNGQLGELI